MRNPIELGPNEGKGITRREFLRLVVGVLGIGVESTFLNFRRSVERMKGELSFDELYKGFIEKLKRGAWYSIRVNGVQMDYFDKMQGVPGIVDLDQSSPEKTIEDFFRFLEPIFRRVPEDLSKEIMLRVNQVKILPDGFQLGDQSNLYALAVGTGSGLLAFRRTLLEDLYNQYLNEISDLELKKDALRVLVFILIGHEIGHLILSNNKEENIANALAKEEETANIIVGLYPQFGEIINKFRTDLMNK